MTSKTADLDATIELLNGMLQKKNVGAKDKLAITDRLLKAYALKYRHDSKGQGGKFASLGDGADPAPTQPTTTT